MSPLHTNRENLFHQETFIEQSGDYLANSLILPKLERSQSFDKIDIGQQHLYRSNIAIKTTTFLEGETGKENNFSRTQFLKKSTCKFEQQKQDQPAKNYLYWPTQEMPKFFPLMSLRIGIWQSLLHIQDQLFIMLQDNKFILVVVHPSKEVAEPQAGDYRKIDFSWQKNKKNILKLFGNRSPYSTVVDKKSLGGSSSGGSSDIDFYGVVTFEVDYKEVVGMEYTNMLIENSSRVVFEAKTLVKKSFHSLQDFSKFYGIDQEDSNLQNLNQGKNSYYEPHLDHQNEKINLQRVYPFDKKSTNDLDNTNSPQKQQISSRKVTRKLNNVFEAQNFDTAATRDEKAQSIDHPQNENSLNRQPTGDNDKDLQEEEDEYYMRVEEEDDTQSNQPSQVSEPLNENNNQQYNQQNIIPPQEEVLVLDQRTYKDFTIIAYFDDPIFPYALKETINLPKNKKLLTLYEASLPSWTVVLAQYGYYKPWFRFAVKYIIFTMSLITMIIGFYDLYKNVPILKDWIRKYLEGFLKFFEEMVILRLSFLLGYFIYFSTPFNYLVKFIFSPGVFGPLAALIKAVGMELIYPIQKICWLLKVIFLLLKEIVTPIFQVFVQIYLCILSLLKLIFYVPTLSILKILSLIKDAFLAVWLFVKSIFQGLAALKRLLPGVKSTIENKETTFNIIQLFTQIALTWSQSLTNKIIKASKAVYDFVMYVSGEISKHKYSLYMTVREYFISMYQKKKRYLQVRKDKIFKFIKITFRIFVVIMFLKFLYIIRREYFGHYGCIICDEFKDKTSIYIHEKFENFMDFSQVLNQFHNFVDWLLKDENKDLSEIAI